MRGGSEKSQNLDVRYTRLREACKSFCFRSGRCNFTNLNVDKNIPREFYPRGASAIRKSLLRFGARAAIEFFEKLGVKSKVESGGRVFPASDKAEDVAEALTAAALRNGAVFELGSRVKSISKVGDKFELACGRFNGDDFSSSADAVMVCVGGSWNGSLRKSLEAFGHSFDPLRLLCFR
ncbi:MAG: NAD(P)/FAD-dependent oxidoreductase [Bacilli bacterium]